MDDNSSLHDLGKSLLGITVRLIGLFLLLAGLWVAIQVMLEALDLYENPDEIDRFALAIERGSNIDKSLHSMRESFIQDEETGDSNINSASENTSRTSNDIRISYFFAWVIVLLLLLLIARIALAAIKTGGELVLYDLQVNHFARALIKEASKLNH